MMRRRLFIASSPALLAGGASVLAVSPDAAANRHHRESLMARYLVVRLYSMALTLLGLTVLVFLMLHLIPGTVVEQMIGADAMVSQQMVDQLKRFFGLDQPWYVQYGRWLGQLLRGDLGTSWRTGKPVLSLILERLPVTIELTVLAVAFSVVLGVGAGILSAVRRDRPIDHAHAGRHASRAVGAGLLAGDDVDPVLLPLPPLDAAGHVGRLPDRSPAEPHHHGPPRPVPRHGGRRERGPDDALLHARRPRAPTTCGPRSPRAWPARPIVLKHALKNAMIPVVTVVGLQLGILLGGTVVVEEVFTLPGVGRLVLWSIYQRDYPVTQSTILFIAALFMAVNLAVDLCTVIWSPASGTATERLRTRAPARPVPIDVRT